LLFERRSGFFMPQIQITPTKYAFVDKEDFDLLNQYKWSLNVYGYAYRNYSVKNGGMMHRLIMKCPKDSEVDHINHNPLDNRKENLRVCSRAENARNSNKKVGSSIYKGVMKFQGKWRAKIKFFYKDIHIGMFDNEFDAAQAYDLKAKELFGNFAKLNFT
jgi:HNH endonuclease